MVHKLHGCAPLPQVAEAMVRSPWVSKWVLKVDDELLGCGHASFSTLAIKGAAEVLERWALA